MKRSASQISSDSNAYISSDEMKPDTTPPPPSSAAKSKPTPKEPSTPKPKKKRSDDGSPSRAKDINGLWTPEKRAELMAKVIDAGFKQMNLESVASEVSIPRDVK
jgi:hypothetical protein